MSASSSKSTFAGAFTFDGDTANTDKRAQLDHYYYVVKSRLLSQQSGTLGLFKKGSSSLPVAPVRDNVYNATALWALSVAYRSFGNDNGRGYELQQSAVKCMRAILICYMRNAKKVERFKATQSKDDCLPAQFHFETGESMSDQECSGDLQVDAVALYLLQLAQMTAAGLQVIFSMDEVNFVQNLIYYIERAYRTPDFGMWQRGHKDNSGRMELHASSIGLAKAALESMSGLNLFGAQGTTLSTAHVDPDAHHRNSATLCSLLPRESNSKETDAALLPIIGFPAYAIDDRKLADKTRERVLSQLKGCCGLKRFSRDGQYTVLEQSGIGSQDPTETRVYDGVECEWPVFLCYTAIEKFGFGDKAGAQKCLDELDHLLDKEGAVPRCYVVEKACLEAEKISSSVQHWQPLQEDQPWLWAQSLYITTCLLISGLVDLANIDPLGRHLPGSLTGYRPVKQDGLRIAEKNTVVQISLVAENAQLQARLATYGIATQTVQQVEPIVVLPQSSLVQVFKELGVNRRLSLSGRPSRPKGALGTSMVYRIKGDAVVFTPLFLDQTDFYMSADMNLLIDVIKDNLRFIYTNWNKPKRPLMVLLLRANHVWGKHFQELMDMMAAFKQGGWDGVPVKLGRLQQFIATSFVEQLDFVQHNVRRLAPQTFLRSNTLAPRMSRVSLFTTMRGSMYRRSPPPPLHEPGEQIDFSKLYDSGEIMKYFEESVLNITKMMLLSRLFLCHGPGFRTPLGTVAEVVKGLYDSALSQQDWHGIRIGASLLGKTVDSLAPSISLMVAVNRQVCLGVFGHVEHVISEPLPPAEIQTALFNSVRPHQVADASLQQELVIFLGGFISSQPGLFEGMQRIRLGWLTQAMTDELKMSESEHVSIYQLAPSSIKHLLLAVLSSRHQNPERTWLQQRRREGSLNRVPAQFYERVLQVLLQSQGGMSLYKYHLPQEPLVQDNKPQDKSFILCVEELLSQSPCPEYRQLVVELLVVLSSLFERNTEVTATETVSLDKLLKDAACLYAGDNQLDCGEMSTKALTLAFAQSYPHGSRGTTTYLLRAAANHLLHSDVDFDVSKCIVS